MVILRYIAFPDCVMVAPQILVLIVGVRVLLGENKKNVELWSLRLSVRTKDSQSLKRGSIPLGTVKDLDVSKSFFCLTENQPTL